MLRAKDTLDGDPCFGQGLHGVSKTTVHGGWIATQPYTSLPE